eukprot:31208-Pelagococcus_subviridis.AAC.10
MFSYATSNAARTSSSRTGSGRSLTRTTTSSRSTPSNLDVYSRTASSPLVATASTIGATVPRMEEKSTRGRFKISTRSSAERSFRTYVRMLIASFAGSAIAALTRRVDLPGAAAARRAAATRRTPATLRAAAEDAPPRDDDDDDPRPRAAAEDDAVADAARASEVMRERGRGFDAKLAASVKTSETSASASLRTPRALARERSPQSTVTCSRGAQRSGLSPRSEPRSYSYSYAFSVTARRDALVQT